ncbi:MAG: 23S rRNA (guanosine(2251)-2'-O)-methyltransferase RlmB [Lachnospiraceae bacterium]|nr:23S rRNA (guanosine(2251)-2'-O)-methyltransferase RlmB [Lachnospiraceae bacterium]
MSRFEESVIEGRNEVIEAFRSGKTVDRLFLLDGAGDGPIQTIKREAKKQNLRIDFVDRKRLDEISVTGKHQGVIAYIAAYKYAELDDIFSKAEEKNEDPFIFILDNIVDPHNLGAIIRTANMAGAHGVIIPKNRAVGLTAAVAKASAGAINYTPVVKVTNLRNTIEELKERGLWFACADMDGDCLFEQDLTGPIGIVIGSEGEGVGRLIKENCDYRVAIPTSGDIDSLNASVAAGVMAFEVVRQRHVKSRV